MIFGWILQEMEIFLSRLKGSNYYENVRKVYYFLIKSETGELSINPGNKHLQV